MKFEALYNKIMNEMAQPGESHRSTMYYHGTGNLDSAIGILKNGFKAQEICSRKLCAPVKGKVYMTPSLETAMIYAFEGYAAGHKESRKLEGPRRYGAIFEIPGTELGDIQPDEDSVGEILKDVMNYFDKGKDSRIYDDYKWHKDMYDLKWIYALAKTWLTPLQWQKVVRHDDEYHIYDAGKKLVKYMTDWQKLQLIDMGAHIANEGHTIVPKKAWLINRLESEKYKKDGSNFFQLAKEVGLKELEDLKNA